MENRKTKKTYREHHITTLENDNNFNVMERLARCKDIKGRTNI